MKNEIERQELIDLIDLFINSQGLWEEFKAFCKSEGYPVKVLGFSDDEE